MRSKDAAVIETYLARLNNKTLAGGDKRSADKIREVIDATKTWLADPDLTYVQRLKLVAKLRKEEQALKDVLTGEGLTPRDAFIKVAKAWGEEAGVTYYDWRELGVSAAVLTEAGIARTGKKLPTVEGSNNGERVRKVTDKQCPYCPRVVGSNNYVRHIRAQHPETL